MESRQDYLSIDTPENVIFDYEVAGIGSRFLAALADTLIIAALQAIVYGVLLLMLSALVDDLRHGSETALTWLAAVLGLIAFAFLWGYYVLFETMWNGQSPGKRWTGLRVVRTDGTPITLTESLIRNLVRLVDFLPAYYGIGVVTMFINEQSRRLGDLAAGTLVIRDSGSVTLESLATVMKPRHDLPQDGEDAKLPVERLGNRHIQMAEEYLRRRHEIANPAAVASQIAKALLKHMGISASESGVENAQDLIAKVVRDSRKRQEEDTY